MVYDYVGNKPFSNIDQSTIRKGHNLDAPSKIYVYYTIN
ncbi:hypothetical protein MPR_1812 [Myroides profundi]|nr:hypothetical protein MPR_1812 [Myroides profundi]